MNYDVPPITARLGFTVTETVRPPEPVVPDPFILAPAAQGGGGVAANGDAPKA